MAGTKIRPRGKVPPSLRTDICANAHVPHVPSWNPRTRPVAPSSVLPFPSQTHDRFSFRPSPLLFLPVPPPSRLPIPAAVIFLSSSSAGDPLIATSNRLSPCPFVGSTDLQHCDCESPALFARLHHTIASDPAASNNPPPAPSFPTASQLISPLPIRSLRPAEPRVQGRLFRIEGNSTQQQLFSYLHRQRSGEHFPRLLTVMKSPAAKSDRVCLSLT